MKSFTNRWTPETGWNWPASPEWTPDLVLYFGATSRLEGDAPAVRELASKYSSAVVCGCSTAGEIHDGHVFDDSVVAALVHFDATRVRAVTHTIGSNAESRNAGHQAAQKLCAPDLRHVLLISEGLSVNGTELIAGMREVLPPSVAITGGLAGDGARFKNTFVGLGADVRRDQIVAIGFYGAGITVSYGSQGGWEAFGPRRHISRSRGNVLFELDDQPALALYKRFLGERAAGLPATGLLFPLELTRELSAPSGLVRTILSVDEAQQSLTFAGDMPEGWYARLMKADAGQLVDGAAQAGTHAAQINSGNGANSLALLVSCVGRRLVLGQRTEEEIEAVMSTLPKDTGAIGFYSYGEVCPVADSQSSELHNQTMTVTLITENT